MAKQFYGKKDSTMIEVPTGVKKEAKMAFELRNKGFKGATETGWKRAHQLVNSKSISIQDIRFMRNWYARHVYTSYPGFLLWKKAGKPNDKKWHNKRSIISWLTWGGDSGRKWVNSQIGVLNDKYNKKYTIV